MNFLHAEEYIGFEDAVLPDAMGAGVLGAFMLIYFVILFLAFAFSIVSYVLQGLGMYTIAERRGIRSSWLAWVPIGNLWVLGSISDQYQYLAKGKIKNKRKAMLGLSIGMFVAYFAMIVLMVMAIEGDEILAAVGMLFIGLAMMTLAIVLTVLQYFALYDLFCSCQPSNAVLYLVLSIFVSVTLPFFVFFVRKKDLGMPPRKQPAPQQVVVPTVEVVVDPNVVEKVVVPTVEPVAEGFAQPEEFEEE